MTRRRMKFTGACPIGDRPPEPDHNHSQSLSKPSGCPHNGVHFRQHPELPLQSEVVSTARSSSRNGFSYNCAMAEMSASPKPAWPAHAQSARTVFASGASILTPVSYTHLTLPTIYS